MTLKESLSALFLTPPITFYSTFGIGSLKPAN
jgi:hypothetical protein